MTLTNFSNITATNTTLGIVDNVNIELTGGFFILFALLAYFVILMINFDAGSGKETFIVSVFLLSTITSFLWLAGLVPMFVAVVTWILTFIAGALMFLIN